MIKQTPYYFKQKGQFFLMGSDFRKSEYETLAWNYIVISAKNGNWIDKFTYDEYKWLCDHNPDETNDLTWLNNAVNDKFLDKDNDYYVINERFEQVINGLLV